MTVAGARRCPLCDNHRGRSVWNEAGYRYLRCERCHAVFADLSAEEYVSVQHNAWNEDSVDPGVLAFYGEARRRAHDAFLRTQRPRGDGKLLDVGCGLGYFLDRAQRAGWETLGCEPSAFWANEARRRVGANRVLEASPADPALDGQSFDLITAWDVVEHVFDPCAFLRRLRSLLAPRGRLFLRTPNLSYVLPVYWLRRHLLGHDAELGPTNHVVYFTASTMRSALGRVGLRPVDWRNYPPPQVAISRSPSDPDIGAHRLSVRAKNSYGTLASHLSHRTGGRVVLSSDLDVLSGSSGETA